MNQEINDLINALKEAHEAKDTKTAKKIRRMLRKLGWYISKGGAKEEGPEQPKQEETKKEKKAKKEKEEKKEEKEDDGRTQDEEDIKDQWADKIKRTKRPTDLFGTDPANAKKTWRNLCKMFHPDLEEGYEEIMKKINELWSKMPK